LNFYDIHEKKIVKTMNIDAPLTALDFYSDGHTIAVGNLYGNINIYDLRMGANVKISLKGHDTN